MRQKHTKEEIKAARTRIREARRVIREAWKIIPVRRHADVEHDLTRHKREVERLRKVVEKRLDKIEAQLKALKAKR